MPTDFALATAGVSRAPSARMDFSRRTTSPPSAVPLRLARAVWRQRALTPRCPLEPRLDGKLTIVTGGNAGIGLEITRGLAARGAEVLVAARNAATASIACEAIGKETGRTVRHAPLDLADLTSVAGAVERLTELARGRTVDVFVANAGVWPRAYASSAQGHEMAFAVNTLGHHALIRGLIERGVLLTSRVVMLTGDIYIRARECTSDYRYEAARDGGMAYCRSKLGDLWLAAELQRRHGALEVYSAHPGVVASGLGGGEPATGLAGVAQRTMLLDLEAGAQTPLWCATQPGLERGGYYHNTLGLVRLAASDPAADRGKAAAFWVRLEELATQFL